MDNEETAAAFHSAKGGLECAMEDFKRAAEADDRDMKDEVLEAVWNVFGKDLVGDLQSQ